MSRQVARAALRTSGRSTFATASRPAFRQGGRRFYSSEPPKSVGTSPLLYIAGAAVAGAGGFYFYTQRSSAGPTVFTPTKEDYQRVYNDIAARLEEEDDYDDGSYGPVLVRLAWHASGTYDKETKTGGSNGATMRFAPEGDHGANAGLKHARDFLEPIKAKYPWISYSDLWTLAGVTAIQEMQGPVIPWRPGRSDRDVSACTPDGRLPDAAQGTDHLRNIFYRMGFNDQEIVALAGAHALGRCHTDRSGFDGPWTFSPTVLTNDYYTLLLSEKWSIRKWDGPKQFQDKGKTLMMLPADYALIQDKAMKPFVEKYAKDNDAFFKDFSNVIVKLFELGVPFKQGAERMTFKPTND
ncbi:mitochondrial putative cytochrome c peroxidase [Pseudomassariella vexata]|uniref:Peroxidase n=1 Tax=Pseudomassariella vexata TaxID=1141098 RepID=A0A1Y2E6E9_9PEZI|nr:mitochondrial putative cytochrome c peroxidase [Pseudomassariella vexata]ORY66445.1 mitochondrial putative cytochrome c peroxidase [Pseudomassariella vexata]